MDSTEVPLQACPECAEQMPQSAAFCPGCGRAMPVSTKARGKVGALPESIAGALAYISFVPAIIFLFLEPYRRNHFVRFHSIQCLLFCAATIVTAAVLRLVSMLLLMVPVLGPLLVSITVVVAVLAAILLWFVLVVKALQGEMFKLPLLGDLAGQYAGAL
jgi:uncharacterized membrane protein